MAPRVFILLTLNLKFENIFHLVDSSTVLGYLHKEYPNLKPYEEVRITETQAAGQFEGGRLKIGLGQFGLNYRSSQ